MLLDLEMPNIDGFTFLRWLMAYYPTPVLVVSARSDGYTVFRALELGACDFYGKPEPNGTLLEQPDALISKIETLSKIPKESLSKKYSKLTRSKKRVEVSLQPPKQQEGLSGSWRSGHRPEDRRPWLKSSRTFRRIFPYRS
ncbi:MAG: response regulator [Candidatus Manganitrophus sp.]|nr:response regulator [Candidatus Manganitrophus sp.]